MGRAAAVIMAGGRGSRLGLDIPKAMVPLDGRPFLEYLILERLEAGFEPVLVCVGHLSHLITAHFAGAPWRQLPLAFLDTPVRGTGQDLLDCLPAIPTETFLVANGDTVLDAPLDALRSQAERVGDRAVVVLTRSTGVPNEGAFFVADDGAVLT
jgi:D-glycero-alpha-D-manno-heptose 1-phosphate guanylyltransferase